MRIAAAFLLLHLAGCGLDSPPESETSESIDEIEADDPAAGDATTTPAVAPDSGPVNNHTGSTYGGPGPIPHPNV
jgi:hypothetical protein